MNMLLQRAKSFILYGGKNYADGQTGNKNVTHGESELIAQGSANWVYQSAAINQLDAFIWSDVNVNSSNTNYLHHIEDVLRSSSPDLTALYSSAQFPLHYLCVDPEVASIVWFSIEDDNQDINALSSMSKVGGSSTTVTTLSLPGRPGLLGVIENTELSSTICSLNLGHYDSTTGLVEWSETGTALIEYSDGAVQINSTTGFPSGWKLSSPMLQTDGTWIVSVSSNTPTAKYIIQLTTNKDSINNDGNDTVDITATVTDSSTGDYIAGIDIDWSTSLGELSILKGITDQSGQTTTTLTVNSGTGNAVISADTTNASQSSITIIVTNIVPLNSLIIKGARSSYKSSGQLTLSRLVALDPQTLQPVLADWLYDGDLGGESSVSSFRDIKPERLLIITADGYKSRTLNPCNVIGNGEWTDESSSDGAFAARLNDGSCIAWGLASAGGYTPPANMNYDITTFASTYYAFAGFRSDNSVFTWGDPDEGGEITNPIMELKDILEIKGSRGTFAIRKSQPPYIQTWGWKTSDTDNPSMSVPTNIATMGNWLQIIANEDAFVVLNTSGQIFAWGDSRAGGLLDQEIRQLTGVTVCKASRRAFSVIAEGRIFGWGDADYGADTTTVAGINDALMLASTESAFTVLRRNGQIACWGNTMYGNSMPVEYGSRNDIVDVQATYGAFAALCEDGTVLTWGNPSFGGDSSLVQSTLKNIVSISATTGSFAALSRSGSVTVWGNKTQGGDSSDVISDLKNICAIYSNTHAFAAFREDNNLIVWGEAQSGVSDFPKSINGRISYYK